jgi:hypothetical protein
MKKILSNLKLFVIACVIMLPTTVIGAFLGKLTTISWGNEVGIIIGSAIGSLIVIWLQKNKKI